MRVEYEVRTTSESALPVTVTQGVNEVIVLNPVDQAVPSPAPSLPAKTFRVVKRGFGWAMMPVTWPIAEIIKSTERAVHYPLDSLKKSKAWVDRAKSDLNDFDKWTPAERRSVQKQQGIWTMAALGGVLVGMCLPGVLSLLPWVTVCGFFVLSRHNFSRIPVRFDIVRWALFLPQVQPPKENL